MGLPAHLTQDRYFLDLPDRRGINACTSEAEVAVGGEALLSKVHAAPSVDRFIAGRVSLKGYGYL